MDVTLFMLELKRISTINNYILQFVNITSLHLCLESLMCVCLLGGSYFLNSVSLLSMGGQISLPLHPPPSIYCLGSLKFNLGSPGPREGQFFPDCYYDPVSTGRGKGPQLSSVHRPSHTSILFGSLHPGSGSPPQGKLFPARLSGCC